MNIIQKIGIGLFTIAFLLFTAILGIDRYVLSEKAIQEGIVNQYHEQELISVAQAKGILGKSYSSSFAFESAFKDLLESTRVSLDEKVKTGLPDDVKKSDYQLGKWLYKDYLYVVTKKANTGPVASNPIIFFFLTIGLGIIGGLLYMLPMFNEIPGIKHNHIFHNAMTRGTRLSVRVVILTIVIAGLLLYGVYYMNAKYFWSILTVIIGIIIIGLVFFAQKQWWRTPAKSNSPQFTGWLGILFGIYLMAFYVILYWIPQHITSWVLMLDPLSRALNGGEASQWFMYGFLYTTVILVMGIRMFAKYMHNRYQIIRTISVMFFQLAFAFLLPEILVRLNYPYYDFKNIWPLNYTFFFDWNLNTLMSNGALGIFMLVWGISLIVIAVPVITFFYGKRWYCSWVCGCGGLAETFGDPYRQQSDKSLRAWQFERWIVHGVLVFAVVMTAMVLYSYFTGTNKILFTSSDTVRTWYGFLIGSAFAGVVGTGFYPVMGNRVWCRFGCPLAAYLGLVQRFKSRFRITTNGGQCISCGNCSTYCEMGIDVRWYAQRGQDVVRASCVGCGVCAAVCPRGVLRLENSTSDMAERAKQLKTIHISEDQIKIL